MHLKASTLALGNVPGEGGGGVGTGEDVLVHEETPDEVLKLPVAAETGDLEVEDAIVLETVSDDLEEDLEVLDTDVLGHLKAGDLVPLFQGDVAVVEQLDLCLVADLFFWGGHC